VSGKTKEKEQWKEEKIRNKIQTKESGREGTGPGKRPK